MFTTFAIVVWQLFEKDFKYKNLFTKHINDAIIIIPYIIKSIESAKLKLVIPSFNIFSKFINLCDCGPIEKNIKNPNTIIKETSDNKKT